ncbi:Conserved hypothetical protein [Herminiimonas arsenicoxydans]|uniref:DUF465 domain-containing protein n=1 Tax=Herminiimonas arsenicoxydans TaxID=204773 RepID=A4G4J0_HERAR|nr:Conserved hypothetical protein [Herminiimonas arsenicoxydans]
MKQRDAGRFYVKPVVFYRCFGVSAWACSQTTKLKVCIRCIYLSEAPIECIIAKNDNMTISSPQAIHQRIVELEVEHRDLDQVIETLIRDGRHEELQLRRLKKRKLQLKDNITLLRMQLVPDIPA